MHAKIKIGRTVAEAIGVDIPKRHKYRAEPVVVDDIRFDSKAEARRYGELKLLLAEGLITDLEVHPKFDFIVNGKLVGTYRADFRYKVPERGLSVVEDVKGVRVRGWGRTKKLMQACHGIDVIEIGLKPRKKRRKAG